MNKLVRLLLLSTFAGGIFLTTIAQVPPPTNLTATQYTGPLTVIAVKLNWVAPPLMGPYAVKFNIYRKDGGLNEGGNFVKKYSNILESHFMDFEVQYGNTYSFYVTTVTPNGESEASNKVQITLSSNLPGGIIAGVLTDEVTNEPISGGKIFCIPISLNSINPSTATGFVSTTDELGRFRAMLPAATYIIRSTAMNYIPEYYDNVSSFEKATQIIIADKDSVFIDIALAPFVKVPLGVIAGILTNEVDNSPIHHGKINFVPLSPNIVICNSGFTAVTDSLGIFRKDLPPGSYFVRSQAMGFVPEFYDNVSTIQQATQVVVEPNDSVFLKIALTPIKLPNFYTLSGNVSDSLGNPLSVYINVFPLRLNSHFVSNYRIKTDNLGDYSAQVREGDTVIVYCSPKNQDYFPEFYNDKRTFAEADRIYIDGDINNINFILEHKPIFNNGISGVVTDSLGAGVESHITAFPRFYTSPAFAIMPHRKFYHTHTDSLGNYLLTNMIPSQYVLLATPRMGYLPTFFRYDGIQTMNWRLADSVVVEPVGVVPNINFTVKPVNWYGFARISGVVSDNSGNKINGAYILALEQNQQTYSFAISDINGKFCIEGVTPGTYTLVIDKMGYTCNQSFNVTVDYLNNVSTDINFTLTPDSVTSVSNNRIEIKDFRLYQNYPNPFNPSTTIKYSVPERTNVKLMVYNILGSEVAQLVNETKTAGEYEVTFDASKLSAGVYLYKIEAGNYKATKKLILIK
jgi:hypothetical protein